MRRDRLLQSLGRRGQRHFPIHRFEYAIDAQHGLRDALRGVDSLEPEAIAIRYPRLVDCLVLARHDAHDLAAQHVCKKIGAESIVR